MSTAPTFVHGKAYSRAQIASAVGGGNLQSYLPTVNGRVVCGCFRTDINPDAPEVILPGDGPTIRGAAEVLCSQGGAVPVFMAEGNAKWRYVGRYAVERSSTDAAEIENHRGQRTDVTRVIWLKRAD